MMSNDGQRLEYSRWRTPDGRELTVTEDRPGVVHITTGALSELLRLGGFTRLEEPIRGVPVAGTAQVVRAADGRCVECGSSPSEDHRADCPSAAADRRLHGHDALQRGFEVRPGPGGVERR